MSPGVGLTKHGSQMNVCLTNKPYVISCPKRTHWEEKPNPGGKQEAIKVTGCPELEAKLDVCTRQIKGTVGEKRHQGSRISQTPSHTPSEVHRGTPSGLTSTCVSLAPLDSPGPPLLPTTSSSWTRVSPDFSGTRLFLPAPA